MSARSVFTYWNVHKKIGICKSISQLHAQD
jgi:hypothetical protein